MYLKTGEKSECSGCTACKAICPQNAIIMQEDEEGFLYPQVDKKKCINCGACFRICPNIVKSSDNNIIEVYGAKHKNQDERMSSRSGGIFVGISDYIFSLKNSFVYGVCQGKDNLAYHIRTSNKEEAKKLKGSKYLQSDMNESISMIKKDLTDGKNVLFSGTSCQVAAIKKVIPKVLENNLYTVDIICHGVPSKKVFIDFLDFVEKTENKRIKDFIFRDKDFGWNTHYETFIFEDGTKKSTQYFRNLFYDHNILRPSCYTCNFANANRPADITIADFWGIDEVNSNFNDNKGVSLVIINTIKGKEIFEKIKEDFEIIEVSVEDCMKHTYTLNQPTPKNKNREQFWKDYKENTFDYIIEKYAK